jgi:uncharacterized protein (TIGR02246 family)
MKAIWKGSIAFGLVNIPVELNAATNGSNIHVYCRYFEAFPLNHSPKRFEIFIGLLALLAFVFCPTVVAQERNGWELDSLRGNPNVSQSDAQQVYEVLLKMSDRWNAHDIEGYMEVYWKSPELLVVVDSEQFNGWQQLHNSYLNGYPDRNAMGFIEPKRIQVKLLKPDLALALTWWSVSFPSSQQKVVGNSTMNLQKFDDGWKIVASHTSIAEM